MCQDLFIEAIKGICRMASIGILQVAVETGYMQNPYNPGDLELLD